MEESEYMTVGEFAGLGSDAHHAVWRAAAEGRIDWIPFSRGAGALRRYRRARVKALLRELEAARAHLGAVKLGGGNG